MAELEPRNFLQPCLLLLLMEQPDHGYELAVRLRPMHDGDGDAGGGVPGAARARAAGAGALGVADPSSVGPARRTYYITADGVASLDRSRGRSAHDAERRCTCSSTATRGWSRRAPTTAQEVHDDRHPRRPPTSGRRTRAGTSSRPASASAAPELARACHAMAGRFAPGGRLLAFGQRLRRGGRRARRRRVRPPGDRRQAGAAGAGAARRRTAATVELFGGPDDIALALAAGDDAPVAAGLAAARAAAGCSPSRWSAGPTERRRACPGLDHLLVVPSDDPRVVREGHVTDLPRAVGAGARVPGRAGGACDVEARRIECAEATSASPAPTPRSR